MGYWDLFKDQVGPWPDALWLDANTYRSDLYLITPSNITFERDPLRYGGDERQSSDEFWIKLCEEFDLPYHVLDGNTIEARRNEASSLILPLAEGKLKQISYDREQWTEWAEQLRKREEAGEFNR